MHRRLSGGDPCEQPLVDLGIWRALVSHPHLVVDGALLPPPVDPTLRASGRWLIPTPNVWCLPFGAFDGLMLPPFSIVTTGFFRLSFLLRSNLSSLPGGVHQRIYPVDRASVPDLPAGTQALSTPRLFLAHSAMKCSVAADGSQLYLPRFLLFSAPAALD